MITVESDLNSSYFCRCTGVPVEMELYATEEDEIRDGLQFRHFYQCQHCLKELHITKIIQVIPGSCVDISNAQC